MTTTFLAPDPVQSTFFVPGTATPGNGVQLFTYLAGTNTPVTVYKDNAAAASWTNPIVLDSGGNLASGGSVWIAQGVTVKFIWAPSNDTSPPISPYRTIDNVAGVNDIVLAGVEWIAGTTAPTFLGTTSFSVTGDQTATYQVGRRVKTSNTAGTVYGTITSSVFSTITTVIIQADSGALDSGLSAVSYGLLSASHPAIPQSTFNAQPQINARISVLSDDPAPATDVVGTTAVYMIPYQGNTIDIYDGSNNWNRYTFNQVSTAVPTTSIVHDVFALASSGTVKIETVAWSTNAIRLTNLTTVAGMPVKVGDGHLYMGTVFPTSSGVIPDTYSTRTVWNRWNQIDRTMGCIPSSGSYTYPQASSGIPTVLGGSSTLCITAVYGQSTNSIVFHSVCGRNSVATTAATLGAAVCIDSFNNLTTGSLASRSDSGSAALLVNGMAMYSGMPGIGLHTMAPVVQFVAVTSFIFIGSSGAIGNTGLWGTYHG